MKFDIILPSIGRQSLQDAIDSVIAQDYPEWKLYVLLNGVDSLASDLMCDRRGDDRIQVLSCEKICNDSGTWARNEGIAIGSNPWIAYIDDDDLWLPNHLSTVVNAVSSNSAANMVKTSGQSFKVGRAHPRTSAKVRKAGPVNHSDILTVGMTHTRQIFYETVGWQPQDNHDKLLWEDMLGEGGVAEITEDITFLFKI